PLLAADRDARSPEVSLRVERVPRDDAREGAPRRLELAAPDVVEASLEPGALLAVAARALEHSRPFVEPSRRTVVSVPVGRPGDVSLDGARVEHERLLELGLGAVAVARARRALRGDQVAELHGRRSGVLDLALHGCGVAHEEQEGPSGHVRAHAILAAQLR